MESALRALLDDAMSKLYEFAAVKDVEYTENGASVRAVADKKSAGMFAKYIKK